MSCRSVTRIAAALTLACAALSASAQDYTNVHMTLLSEANLPGLVDKFRATAVTGDTRLAHFYGELARQSGLGSR